jgi:hypothetical protein
MQKILKTVVTAALVLASGVSFADSATISQNGGAPVNVFPAQTGAESNPYLLGVLGSGMTSLDVIFSSPFSTSVADFATFTIPSAGSTTAGGGPLGVTIQNVFTNFDIYLYKGDLQPSGNPNGGTNMLLGSFASGTSSGSLTGNWGAGNFFFYIAATEHPVVPNVLGYHLEVTTAVPEPETYALMLAGLGVIGFLASRRNKV